MLGSYVESKLNVPLSPPFVPKVPTLDRVDMTLLHRPLSSLFNPQSYAGMRPCPALTEDRFCLSRPYCEDTCLRQVARYLDNDPRPFKTVPVDSPPLGATGIK